MHIEWDEAIEVLIYDQKDLLEKVISKGLEGSGKSKLRIDVYRDTCTHVEIEMTDLDTSEIFPFHINLENRVIHSYGLDTDNMKLDTEIQLSID